MTATITTRTTRGRWATIVVLAAVLSLDSADRSTLSAVEAQLEPQLGMSSFEYGVLAATTPVVALLLIVPVGVLVDRVVRTRLLAIATTVWAGGEVVAALAPSYGVLLVGRCALAAVLAGLPAVTSLTGDLFAADGRGRVWGYILAGELVGTAIGFLGTGTVGASAGWRWGFAALAALGVAVAVGVWFLAEPGRGTQHDAGGDAAGALSRRLRREGHVPTARSIPGRDPADMTMREVLGYLLRVRSNVVLVIASALTYLFLSGVQVFAVRFGSDQFGLVGSGATLMLVGLGAAAIVGVLVTGRVADRLIAGHCPGARVIVAAGTLLVSLACFLPGTLLGELVVAAPLLLVGAAALGGSNPPIDAARLDVLHHHAWGRGEALRSVLRLVAYAAAPLLLGALVDRIGTGPAFAVLTAALAAAGVAMLFAVRSYPGDVVAAGTTAQLERR